MINEFNQAIGKTMKEITKRVIIENVTPEIEGGRFAARRAVGEKIVVEGDIFADGHDIPSAQLLYRKKGDSEWRSCPMNPMLNDRYQASFEVKTTGRYEYTVEAWIDPFKNWWEKVKKKEDAGENVSQDLVEGGAMIEKAALRAPTEDANLLSRNAKLFQSGERLTELLLFALTSDFIHLMAKYPDKTNKTDYSRILEVSVEPLQARFSAWYEMFPRSCADDGSGRHGTFIDCIERLPYIAEMGFDVLYLPPIHPIGVTSRKGRNNTSKTGPNDPGSPWAIGSEDGGHRSIHPELGTFEDFQKLIGAARRYGIEIALDIAFQCSPDHPYVSEHPEWFRKRPDGSIQYAENPPKKYEDIFPLDFETEHAQELCRELLDVVLFWIERGVRIFRVDNPHTKPLRFWEWLIGKCKEKHPDVIFLSEAFTRPKTMHRLARGGFTQSYTYFTWRNLKWEIEQYFEALTQSPTVDYFWPNLWPNTPDILPEYLQMGGRPAFLIRLVLAATLSSSYGVYGPAFELCVDEPKEPGSEEYNDSEKYEIVQWDLNQPCNLKGFIQRINRIRRINPALQQNKNLIFHPTQGEDIVCYSKFTDDLSNIILTAVNLDPHHTHSTILKLPLKELDLDDGRPFQMHDLISDARYMWRSNDNYLELDPHAAPAHIFRIRRKVRTERDFDYFM